MAEESVSSSDTNSAMLTAVLGGAATEEARALLREQTRLVRLQAQDLEREDKVRHWSLLLRHASDILKVAFELALALIFAAIVAIIGGALWSAAHDNSLVIEAFSVPPDMAARGLTGQAVAAQLQDKLAAMQDATDTARPSESYANNWGNDIKVQIPDTGVSVGEFYRLLVSWLGHQTRITGEVWRGANGLAITARASGQSGDTVRGSEADLDGLLQKAAEAVYARTQPYRYGNFKGTHDPGNSDSARIMRELVASGSLRDRVWVYQAFGTRADRQDPLHAPGIYAQALPLAPDFALPYMNLAKSQTDLGRPEIALGHARKAVSLLSRGDGEISARAARIGLLATRAQLEQLQGDFLAALRDYQQAAQMPNYSHFVEQSRGMATEVLGRLHEFTRARQMRASLPPDTTLAGRVLETVYEFERLEARADWRAIPRLQAERMPVLESWTKQLPFAPPYLGVALSRQIWPYSAEAQAHLGNFAQAHALADRTPLDCYACLLARGRIDVVQENWAGADYWFDRAAVFAPSIPFAETDWGEMLLRKGDLDGAVAKFESAHKKGPHFADPLEMWGEALIAKNRSDLALAKFEEANRYAPNWGRLHLKWGEALWWSGDHAGARKQFALASRLDLTPSERIELTKPRGHS